MRGDENKIFDEFLRSSLANYQVPPSPGLWSALKFKLFSRSLLNTPFFNGSAGLIGSISTAILVTGLTSWYMVGKVDNRIAARDTATHKQISVVQADTFQTNSAIKEGIEIASTLKTDEIKTNSNKSTIELRSSKAPGIKHNAADNLNNTPTSAIASSTQTKNHKKETVARELVKNDPKPTKNQLVISSKEKRTGSSLTQPLINKQNFEPLMSMSGRSYPIFLASANDQMIAVNPFGWNSLSSDEILDILKKDLRSHYDYARSPKLEWSAGIAASPEWLLTNSGNDFGKKNMLTSVFVRAKRQHFFLETGISVYTEKTSNTQNVNYLPLLGSYQNLDSVTFVYDPQGGPQPTYYYHEIKIYDSIIHMAEVSQNASCTFAGIPVLVGYSYDFGRHGFTFKTGPVFSYMISKNLPSPEFSLLNEDKIITSVNTSNVRNKMNLQWKFEMNYQYALSSRVTLLFGPYYTATISQPYERKKLNSGLPAYFGTKAGLMWNF